LTFVCSAARLLADYGTAGKGGRGPPVRVEYEKGKKETRLGTAGAKAAPFSLSISSSKDDDLPRQAPDKRKDKRKRN
jgi:hypothetical protein